MRYRLVFGSYSRERQRLDAILAGKPDPFPGTCNHPEVEACIVALARGEKAPVVLPSLAPKPKGRGKSRTETQVEANIIAPVANALAELFEAREGR